jgi:hypothetical protein
MKYPSSPSENGMGNRYAVHYLVLIPSLSVLVSCPTTGVGTGEETGEKRVKKQTEHS